MRFKTINADGDYVLSRDSSILRETESTTVVIESNIDAAVITFGYADSSNNFKAFPSGIVADGAVISHGCGCRLMVNVNGITANPVVIGYSC